jgi:hypothetical protein
MEPLEFYKAKARRLERIVKELEDLQKFELAECGEEDPDIIRLTHDARGFLDAVKAMVQFGE